MQLFDIVVKDLESGERIDKVICLYLPEYTRSSVQKLIEGGFIKVDKEIKDKNYKVKEGQVISVYIPDLEGLNLKPENIPLDIRYEDQDLLVVNKKKGMVVHPAPGHNSGTLVNALLYHCKDSLSGINGVARPGIVHRIDKDTSGLLIVAKNDFSHKIISKQIKQHSFKREYRAIVHGNLKHNEGIIELNIGRHPKNRKKMAVTEKNSKIAITNFKVEEMYKDFTDLKLSLKTGRTHQIRVHMAHIGHPVVGDEVYGRKSEFKFFSGQCLHAKTIGFLHPRSGKHIEIISELPKYFSDLIYILTLR